MALTRIDYGWNGQPGITMQFAQVSTTGRHLLFEGEGEAAMGLEGARVFVRDLLTGKTETVAFKLDGTLVADAYAGFMSADGRYVVYTSAENGIVAGDDNNSSDVFRYDRTTGQTMLVPSDWQGGIADGGSLSGAISANGRYVAFFSDAADLVDPANYQGGYHPDRELYVRDLQTDKADGGAGDDVIAIQGNYAGLTLGAESLVNVETLTLLTHTDARFGGSSATPYSYDITTVDANIAAPGGMLKVNASTLKAGENFTFDGSAESDGFYLIYGGKGVDTLTGGAGADVFFFAEDGRYAVTDRIDGGAGEDILVLRGDYALTLTGTSLVNVETVALSSGTDARFYPAGTPFNYTITTAEDTVAAGATMTINGGKLLANEVFVFDGAAETDGSFRLFGGFANDTIRGGAGNDLIFGGVGADQLTGGGGNDVFRYQGVAESTAASRDTIADFSIGDLLDLSRIDANSATAGDQAFTFIGAGAFTGLAGQLRAIQGAGNSWTVEADVNGDGAADLQLVIHTGDGHALSQPDFVL